MDYPPKLRKHVRLVKMIRQDESFTVSFSTNRQFRNFLSYIYGLEIAHFRLCSSHGNSQVSAILPFGEQLCRVITSIGWTFVCILIRKRMHFC